MKKVAKVAKKKTAKVTYETVAQFLKRGGEITYAKPMNARGAQKKQTIKVPRRFMGLVK